MCHVIDVSTIYQILVAGKSAYLIMCGCSVVPAMAASTVNVDRVKPVACLLSSTGK